MNSTMSRSSRHACCSCVRVICGYSVAVVVISLVVSPLVAAQEFIAPDSPRHEYSFDLNWKFFKEDKAKLDGAEGVAFDDSAWETVTTPHTYNDVDSFRTWASHSGGDRGTWKG